MNLQYKFNMSNLVFFDQCLLLFMEFEDQLTASR